MSGGISSWLSGPESVRPDGPVRRPGSPAPMGRRLLALLVDWLIAAGLAGLAVTLGLVQLDEYLISGDWQSATMVIWLVLGAVAVRLFGFTPGQYLCGLRVVPFGADGPGLGLGVGIGRAVGRGLLIALVIPPLFTDADGRGLQDRATGTAVVRR